MYAIIDADVLFYKHAYGNTDTADWGDDVKTETFNEKEAIDSLESDVESLYTAATNQPYNPKRVVMVISEGSNYRYSLYNEYKANRKSIEKPKLYHPLRDYTLSNYPCLLAKGLEGDDIMGLVGSSLENSIVVSIDKDMLTVPNINLYIPNKEVHVDRIPPIDAYYQNLMQTLIGDSTDNYKGCPGIGKKKAEKILQPIYDEYNRDSELFFAKAFWEIQSSYEDKGLSLEDALMNLKLSQIMSRRNLVDVELVNIFAEPFQLKFNVPGQYRIASYETFPIKEFRLYTPKGETK